MPIVSSTWPPKRSEATPVRMPLAGGIDRRCGARRAAADDKHVEGRLGRDLLGRAFAGAGIELGQNLLQAHTALREGFAVQEHRGHGHHAALLDLVLEQGAVDRGMADLGIEHAHQVQRLHHVGAVLAGQREIGLECPLAVQSLDAGDRLLRLLAGMAADLQQRQDQGRELVAHRQAGEAHGDACADAHDGEGGPARIVVAAYIGHLVGERGDLFQQLLQLTRLRVVAERRHQLHRPRQAFEISLQLRLEVGVQH